MNHAGEKGFTLVEVLAALLIFSTAILGLMHAGTENIRAMNAVEQKQIAGIVADNQLILALNNEAPLRRGSQQDSSKMAGREWHWQIRTEQTEEPDFYKLTATVRLQNAEQILLTRTAFASNSKSSNE